MVLKAPIVTAFNLVLWWYHDRYYRSYTLLLSLFYTAFTNKIIVSITTIPIIVIVITLFNLLSRFIHFHYRVYFAVPKLLLRP